MTKGEIFLVLAQKHSHISVITINLNITNLMSSFLSFPRFNNLLISACFHFMWLSLSHLSKSSSSIPFSSNLLQIMLPSLTRRVINYKLRYLFTCKLLNRQIIQQINTLSHGLWLSLNFEWKISRFDGAVTIAHSTLETRGRKEWREWEWLFLRIQFCSNNHWVSGPGWENGSSIIQELSSISWRCFSRIWYPKGPRSGSAWRESEAGIKVRDLRSDRQACRLN